jgi:hypothetical protein
MTTRTRPRRWREVERRPVPGNSPNDRILRGPDCNRPKRAYADSFPATPWPTFLKTHKIPGRRFLRHAESIGPMCSSNPRPECRLPLVGPRAPAKRTRRKERALLIVRDEFRPAIPRSGCSPALPISASPARPNYHAPSPRLVKTGHFYFAENRTFLFCVNT